MTADAANREWDRAKAQKTQWKEVELLAGGSLLQFSSAVDHISDHDQANLRARGVELLRRLRDFHDMVKKARP